jgi:antitoxin (DNA-binding transcriptional repressor) of toxin-antitoxin stability system
MVSLSSVKTITSKVLHEETRRCLDRVRQGERLQVVRGGQTDALLVPPDDAEDPSWPEIMKDVWAAQKKAGSVRRNPVLAERIRRNHAGRLR